ncbi:hypothetical protein Mlute_02145 [Meiothermus luteus]|jgi:hypothetical protein|uniref:Uncharacterized protein n=1 Tax=Meiothermus luteus TaxID=2026184 RepID=A0A399EJG7_9DEIN|nr:hypothetical protein [Meiothermus luteus]RIH83593.1 hypothetical protein Mlute_02145 [Meiothermus luteus]RMH56408.1 MAG: hypothetical protein D6684_05475 [Deinococcota bacterium]
MDVLLAALLLGLVAYFLLRILKSFLLPGPRPGARERCPVCREALNPAQAAALRQGRRKCPQMARCPYQRSRWIN